MLLIFLEKFPKRVWQTFYMVVNIHAFTEINSKKCLGSQFISVIAILPPPTNVQPYPVFKSMFYYIICINLSFICLFVLMKTCLTAFFRVSIRNKRRQPCLVFLVKWSLQDETPLPSTETPCITQKCKFGQDFLFSFAFLAYFVFLLFPKTRNFILVYLPPLTW